jgi:membrane protein DedA with SNARE-associated domain
VQALAGLVARYGLPLVFANVLAEQLGLPIPAIPTLIVAGAFSIDRDISAFRVLLWTVVACLIADTVWFALGRRYGLKILKTLCRISLSPDSCVRETSATFEKWGMPSLLVAKFIPGFSTVAPPLAGATGARFPVFLFYDAGGSLLWGGSGVVVGVIFHRAIDRGLDFLTSIGSDAVILLAAALAVFIAVKWYQRHRFYRALRMARITPEGLFELIEGGKGPVVVDVRTDTAIAADPRRIPGALAIRMSELDARVAELPMDREIILYCT